MAHDLTKRQLVPTVVRELGSASIIVALLGWGIASSFGLFPAQHPADRVELRLHAAAAAKPHWRPLRFKDPVIGKNFYLFDAIASSPDMLSVMTRTPALAHLKEKRIARLADAATRCGPDVACHVSAFSWSDADVAEARTILAGFAREPAVETFVEQTLASSGMFVRYGSASAPDLLGRAWEDAAAGMNRIVDVYAVGTPPLYPLIDAVSYDVSSDRYRRLVSAITDTLYDDRDNLALFYESSLRFARHLLDANRRDEAGRHEPLHLGENAAAFQHIAAIDWAKYPYAVILVPGAGSDRPEVRLDPAARLRLELAVARYKAGKAPLIVVSGGYVHPAQTPFAEALEMKRALKNEFGVPEEAILVDPHARHTTTNLRNAARLMFRYGIPTDKPSLVTSDRAQSAYIEGQEFRDRCQRELGYQPAEIGRRVSPFDLEFMPKSMSLHADARDPLDP